MARLIVLGSAAAISDAEHDNTYFALHGDRGGAVLVDCCAHPLAKLDRVGIHHDALTDVILTHFHPDHVSGFPLMLMQLWLLGRKRTLHVYGLHHCIDGVEKMMSGFQWESWPDFFMVAFHRVPEQDGMLVLDNDDFRITSWPTQHFIPTMGLRIAVKSSGKVVGYSSDTEPAPGILNLARDADLLLHEASGEGPGHSSPAQAGIAAARANARRLALIHYTVNHHFNPDDLLEEARAAFAGPVDLARDFDVYDI